MDLYYVTVYGDDGKVLFSKCGDDQSAIMDLIQKGIIENEVYRTQLKSIFKYKEIRIVIEEKCTACGVLHTISEIQDIL